MFGVTFTCKTPNIPGTFYPANSYQVPLVSLCEAEQVCRTRLPLLPLYELSLHSVSRDSISRVTSSIQGWRSHDSELWS